MWEIKNKIMNDNCRSQYDHGNCFADYNFSFLHKITPLQIIKLFPLNNTIKYKYDIHFADYYFVLALIYMNMGCFEKAINSFLKCIGKTEKIIGTSSYLPNYNIGVIYEVLGDYIEALSYYGKCGQYLPASVRIGKILKNNNIKSDIQLLIEKGNLIKAKQLLRAIEKVMAEDAEIYSLKAVMLIMENNLEEAKSVLKKGLLIAPDDGDLLYNLEYLYEIEKNKQLTK
jgi:tetratricopeptide (TPR) repeat protein